MTVDTIPVCLSLRRHASDEGDVRAPLERVCPFVMRATSERLRGLFRGMVIGAVVALMASGASQAMAAGAEGGMPRVRSTTASIATLIVQGVNWSATLRQLVDTIRRTNGIVYVEEGECGHGVRSCLTHSVVSSGGYRFLRILVDARQPAADLLASIGHELRHAIEVLEDPAITSAEAIFLFYSRGVMFGGEPFETPEAIRAGNAVGIEVERVGKRRPAARLAARDLLTKRPRPPL